MICNYGCGQEALYIFKNNKYCCSKNVSSCPAIKKKISLKNKGKEKDSEWKRKISESKKGKPAWNKGINDYLTSEIRESMGFINKGKCPWNKNKKNIYSDETIERMSNVAKKRKGSKTSNWKGGYYNNNIPQYDIYTPQLNYAEECRRNSEDKNILEVKCAYCGNWYIPTRSSIYERIRTLNGKQNGEQRLYCSEYCKNSCPIYAQRTHSKNFKITTSREVQPELRQMRFKIDNYTCQKCGKHQDELDVALHCHHIEGIRWEPIESADLDKCITVCQNCHIKIHKKEGCGYNDMRCKK